MELTWNNAEAWKTIVNSQKEEGSEPEWRWDCGFKLDFDGPIISVESRFYPPHKNSHPGWEGSLRVSNMGKLLCEKKLKCDSLDQIKIDAEKYVSDVAAILHGALMEKLSEL